MWKQIFRTGASLWVHGICSVASVVTSVAPRLKVVDPEYIFLVLICLDLVSLSSGKSYSGQSSAETIDAWEMPCAISPWRRSAHVFLYAFNCPRTYATGGITRRSLHTELPALATWAAWTPDQRRASTAFVGILVAAVRSCGTHSLASCCARTAHLRKYHHRRHQSSLQRSCGQMASRCWLIASFEVRRRRGWRRSTQKASHV